MQYVVDSRRLRPWLRRHSLTLVAALGGALGVAYAAARLGAGTVPARAAPPERAPVQLVAPRDTVFDTVQVALLLDTSSSMDGLINQARSQLWKMVDDLGRMTRVVNGKTRGVRIELALFEYGNDTLPASDGYIRRVLPFTTDLDQVAEQLHALFTNGGSEYAGQAIQVAASTLPWTNEPAALRFIFVAGNESFDQGPVAAAQAMAAAAGKDITVQLIFCGNRDPSWSSAAALAKSDLMTIDQNRVAEHIPTPQDDELMRLGAALNRTYMAYGSEGRVAAARQASADTLSAQSGTGVAVERAQLKAKAGYRNDSWDVVDAVANDGAWLDKAKDDELPAELRGKSAAEKRQVVAEQAKARAELKAKIAKLEADRAGFLAAEAAKRPAAAAAPSLETELKKTTQKAAAKKGYAY